MLRNGTASSVQGLFHSNLSWPPLPTYPPTFQAIAAGMEGIRRVEQRHISVEEAKGSREVFLVGSSLPIMPVVQVSSLLLPFGGLCCCCASRCCLAAGDSGS